MTELCILIPHYTGSVATAVGCTKINGVGGILDVPPCVTVLVPGPAVMCHPGILCDRHISTFTLS